MLGVHVKFRNEVNNLWILFPIIHVFVTVTGTQFGPPFYWYENQRAYLQIDIAMFFNNLSSITYFLACFRSHTEFQELIWLGSAYRRNFLLRLVWYLFSIIFILSCNLFSENESHSMQNENQTKNDSKMGKTFISNEIFDGKKVGSFKW